MDKQWHVISNVVPESVSEPPLPIQVKSDSFVSPSQRYHFVHTLTDILVFNTIDVTDGQKVKIGSSKDSCYFSYRLAEGELLVVPLLVPTVGIDIMFTLEENDCAELVPVFKIQNKTEPKPPNASK